MNKAEMAGSAGSPNGPEQGDRQGSGGRCVRGHRRRSCQWRGSADYGIRHLRHQKQSGPYRTQSEDRRGRFGIGVDIADVQGREDAEGCREGGSRVMTLQRQPTATRIASHRLNMESSRLLCDDGHTTSCPTGVRKTQGVRRVGSCAAAGACAVSRIRQEGRGAVLALLTSQQVQQQQEYRFKGILGARKSTGKHFNSAVRLSE